MVQRKIINKLGIQAERCKTERLSINLKPSSLHHQDVKSGDVKKKKMKKSGSIKRPEIKTPQVSITTPNYMKATTSSDARKEKSLTSSKTPQTSPQTSGFCRKSTNLEKLPLSCDKIAKTFARTTNLKLTSTPSFKVSAKKSSPVAFCEDLDVQRATCSLTLKEYKFPTYLTLSPGGTEIEGTSAMKVCPYAYCSLNGHRHASLPPLKSFLSAKRRMIKTQRNVKLGSLSPRQTKSINQLDLNNPTISIPLMQEEQNDFFVKIYSQNDETQAKSCEEEVEKMVLEGDIRDEIDINQFLDKNGDNNQTEEDITPFLDEEEVQIGVLSKTESEASDMDLETGNESPVYLDDGYEYNESCVEKDEFFTKLDENVETCFNVLENEVSQESLEGDTPRSNSDEDEESINDSSDYVKIEEEKLDTIASVDVAYQASADDDHQNLNEDQPTDESETCNNEKHDTIRKECNQDSHSSEQEMEDSSLTKATKKPIQDSDESDTFNPRGPNFLPLEPEPEGENVDLRHQELDERKNAEEWMVDYTLRKVVTKLGVEHKRKVALLVEAFEKVIPMTKYEINLAYSSAFESPRSILTCN